MNGLIFRACLRQTQASILSTLVSVKHPFITQAVRAFCTGSGRTPPSFPPISWDSKKTYKTNIAMRAHCRDGAEKVLGALRDALPDRYSRIKTAKIVGGIHRSPNDGNPHLLIRCFGKKKWEGSIHLPVDKNEFNIKEATIAYKTARNYIVKKIL
ncbi:uncharacterized protein FOMMEDRAFT_162922 [Fomitiporia mediterranea MF3/22]|uniref:Uncharacterized protein n=1 Tax=Fomitiporia mediterranea (strain MF3/22) TaxID=694068 RepID=R7SGW6_FOMME|nr:uncharacterized protein FOMMEDRAFT_162922 [Fomitiporia mediterranea MF3/22]EJC97542.1 hypothetical protein FOMMEDRAFT_162922 [Fomitiporia mediterranea MF3/22]